MKNILKEDSLKRFVQNYKEAMELNKKNGYHLWLVNTITDYQHQMIAMGHPMTYEEATEALKALAE